MWTVRRAVERQRLADLLVRLGHPLQFVGSWSGACFPNDVGTLFAVDPDDERTTLRMDLGGVGVNCHFFDETEIEFDLDPREIDGPTRLAAVIDLMRHIARALRRSVLLTEENDSDRWLLRCRTDADEIEVAPSVWD